MSSSAAVRARAAQIVAQVAVHGHSLDAALVAENRGTPQERGLLRALCYDSVRWYIRLDALLGRLLDRPARPMTAEIHSLAIVGLCQLLYTSIPPHAVVDETVNAARVLKQPRAAGLLNAILRRCQRDGAKLLAQIDRDPALRAAHPRWLVAMLAADWAGKSEQIMLANNQRPPLWLRVNRLRCTGAEYRRQLAAAGHEVAASMFDDLTLQLARPVDVSELPGFAEGLVSVQDAAAQMAARLLAPRPADRVLDACAAPGGKTCHVLELQPDLRELVAIDVSKDRLVRVHENLRRLALHATVLEADAAEPDKWWDGRPFERILLDVPCSATGVIRRHPDIKLLRRAEDILALAQRQRQLLDRVWTLLAPGGRLLYSSCSALRAETTAIVEDFLSREPRARDVTGKVLSAAGIAVASEPGQDAGRQTVGYAIAAGTDVAANGDDANDDQGIAGTAGLDGFYYACLEKTTG